MSPTDQADDANEAGCSARVALTVKGDGDSVTPERLAPIARRGGWFDVDTGACRACRSSRTPIADVAPTGLDWVRRSARYGVAVTEAADMMTVKRRFSVPGNLQSCHMVLVAGLALEGHVPLADKARVLTQRPAGVRGLAVAGMEVGDRRGRFDVIAFGPTMRRVFATRD